MRRRPATDVGGDTHHHRMAEHQCAPPEHPDDTLHQPVGFSAELAGLLTAIDPPRPQPPAPGDVQPAPRPVGARPTFSLPETVYSGPAFDLPSLAPVFTWLTFPDRVLEIDVCVIAWIDRAVLVSGLS